MLTRLLGFVPSSRRNSRRNDGNLGEQYSTIEEQHTRSLLFPDLYGSVFTSDQTNDRQSFREAAILAGYPFDQDPPDLSSVKPQNIRILLARDDGFHRTILFDSDTISGTDTGSVNTPRDEVANSPGLGGSRNSPSTGYFESPPDSIQQLSQSYNSSLGDGTNLLTRIRSRGASISSTGDFGRAIKATNEINNLLDCAFGNITLNYLGPSTKIHMLPRANDRLQQTQDASVLVSRLLFLPHREMEGTQRDTHGHAARQSNSKTLRNRKFVAISIMIVVNLKASRKMRQRRSEPLDAVSSLRSSHFMGSDAMNSLSSSVSSSRPLPSTQNITGQQKLAGRFNLESFELVSAFIGTHWHGLERSLTTFQTFVEDYPSVQTNSLSSEYLHSTSASADAAERPQLIDNSLRNLESALIELIEHWKDTLSQLASTYCVTSGQDHWGKWRDETRIVEQASLIKFPERFFKQLLTWFLAYHTEWLDARIAELSLEESQKRRLSRQWADSSKIVTRTVILCRSPASARRLLYYLSSFLPYRPAYREPTGSEIPDELMTSSQDGRAGPFTDPEMNSVSTKDRSRKGSTSKGENWRISENTLSSSFPKSSSARLDLFGRYNITANPIKVGTPSTATQDEAVPFAHFSIHRKHSSPKQGTSVTHRRDGSDASTRLSRALQSTQLVEKTSHLKDKVQFNTDNSAKSSVKATPLLSPLKPRRVSRVSGERKSSTQEGNFEDSRNLVTGKKSEQDPGTEQRPGSKQDVFSDDQLVEDTGEEEKNPSPLAYNLSFNEEDNVYDVEIPTLGQEDNVFKATNSSVEDDMLSSSTANIPLRKAERPAPLAAGYLSRVCAEVCLQAVPPYEALERDVKKIMSYEPTPRPQKAPLSSSFERWINVCRFIIADADEGSVRRILLRRLVSLEHGEAIPSTSIHITSHGGTPDNVPGSASTNEPSGSLSMRTVKEEFLEEDLKQIEPSVSATIDRLLVQSETVSRRGSVRGHSKGDESHITNSNEIHEVSRTECSDLVYSMLESILVDAFGKVNDQTESSSNQDEARSKDERRQDHSPVQQEILRILNKNEAQAQAQAQTHTG